MKRIFSLLILVTSVLFSLNVAAQSKVFVSGDRGYRSFRIPAIVKAPNGDLLAFCEGRLNGSSDFGNIKIVLKRSGDKGKTTRQPYFAHQFQLRKKLEEKYFNRAKI